MSGTVGNYQQGAFTSPTTGQPGDASVVLGNDNNVRSKHNSHDADATIHVQSSVLASRPAAGTAQRVWVTTDGFRAYLDDGANWQELAYLSLAAGGTVAGAVTLSSTLHTVGAATFDGAVNVGGDIVLSGGARVLNSTTNPTNTLSSFYNQAGVGATISGVNVEIRTGLVAPALAAIFSSDGSASIAGVVTAPGFSGPLTGDVTGNVTGNASTATKLATARNINGQAFDGSQDITITVSSLDADSLTGTTLHATVVNSSLTKVGALATGSIASGFGSINIGTNGVTAGSVTLDNGSSVGRTNLTGFTLANNATKAVVGGVTSASRLMLRVLSNNSGAFATLGAFGISVFGDSNAAATYSITSGNAGTVNVFLSAGTLTIENKSGSSLTFVTELTGAV